MSTERDSTLRISAEQIRAARGWLGWSQSDLATAAKVGRKTVAETETRGTIAYDRTLRDMRQALEAAGVEFVFEKGVPVGTLVRPRS